MAIDSTIPIGGIIAPNSVYDTYPVVDPKYTLGGLRTVDSVGDLSLIPSQRLQEGMVAYVSGGASPNFYTYINGSWILFRDLSELASASGNWNSVYTTVSTLSTAWEESAEIIPTVTNYLSTNNVLISAVTVTDYLSTNTVYADGTAGIISDDVNETGNGINTLTLAFQQGVYVEDDLNIVGNLSASTILSDGTAGIISDDVNETGNGVNTLTLAFQQGVFVENNLNVVGSVSATTILSDGSAGIISDDVNETGNGLNTLTLAFINGVFVENNLTVVDLISTGSNLTSREWASNYTTTNSNSGNWSRNIYGIKLLQPNETDINALSTVSFIKNITEQNTFTYSNFAVGQTINVFLSASHNNVLQHYFPVNTKFGSNGSGNILYTFANNITVASITNIGGYYIGTTSVINSALPNYQDLGDYLLNNLGFLLQQNNDRILLQ